MLKSLSIRNFILVKDLELNFEKGLNVLTGETGAGKSIIVGAINIIFGGEIKAGIHLDETKKVVLEAAFSIDENIALRKLIDKYEVDVSEGELFFTKEISPNLRSRIFLNGRRISIPIVIEFRNLILDFHSQRDQQQLFDRDYQLLQLDKFGDLLSHRIEFEKHYLQLEEERKKLNNLIRQEKSEREKIQLFKYQAAEIEAAELKIGEDKKIQAELDLLSNAEEIIQSSSKLEMMVYENENSIYDELNLFISRLEKFSVNDDRIRNIVTSLRESLSHLNDAVSDARELQDNLDLNESRKEELEERLNILNSIMLKYKKNIPQIIEYNSDIQAKIENYSSNKTEISQLSEQTEMKTKKLITEAEFLSQKRKTAAEKFAKEIIKNIRKLAIPNAAVKIKFDKEVADIDLNSKFAELNRFGFDRITFFFSANIGVKMQPFELVASGGELSRFLLTIKKILAGKTDSKTIIFDEIDQGIGGKTSALLAEFISRIDKSHQVICISHLPQIAAYADSHFAINKISDKCRSQVVVEKLSDKNRRAEIARMLSGSLTDSSLQHADELINNVK